MPFTFFVVFRAKSIPIVEMTETDSTFLRWSPFNSPTNWNICFVGYSFIRFFSKYTPIEKTITI